MQVAWRLLAVISVLVGLAWSVQWLTQDSERRATQGGDPPPQGYRDIAWEVLVPSDWQPTAPAGAVDIARLDDQDPRAIALARELRAQWDNAPTVAALDGAQIRLTGYVVPLDTSPQGTQEFLLVPYYGACIHTPPPAANQIVHVRLAQPQEDLRSMELVRASGALKTSRVDSDLGTSGYTLQAIRLERARRR